MKSQRRRFLVVLLWQLVVLAASFSPLTNNGRMTSVSLNAASDDDDFLSRQQVPSSRRLFFQKLGVTTAALSTAATSTASNSMFLPSSAALAATTDGGDEEIEVYFGCGCFWHIQQVFVQAERNLLNRADSDLTARAGYAGGKAGAKDGKVCYHNAAGISDYGSLGHAEVVRLKIPSSKFPEFCVEYCNLFSKDGYRPDQFGDRGPEYRNLVGVPGGVESKYAKQLVEASQSAGDKLDFAKGRGDDPDRRALAFIMDTGEFPFYVAEQVSLHCW